MTEKLVGEVLERVSSVVAEEVQIANADFQLLQEMNKAATGRYEDMERYAGRLKESVDDIASKYEEILPYLNKIADIEKSVEQLELIVRHLDGYTQSLDQHLSRVLS